MKKILTLVGICTMFLSAPGYALTLNSIEGSWSNVLGDPRYQTYVNQYTQFNNDVDIAYGNHAEDQVRWGRPRFPGYSSGLGFTGAAESEFDFGEIFEVGQLRHFNYEIVVATAARSADLELQLGINGLPPVELSFNLTLTVNETPNTPGPVDDIIGFSDANAIQTFTYGDIIYTFELLGFGSTPDDVVTQFISQEGQNSATKLFGRLTAQSILPPEPPPVTPAVPEPTTVLLLGLGLVGLAMLRRRAQ